MFEIGDTGLGWYVVDVWDWWHRPWLICCWCLGSVGMWPRTYLTLTLTMTFIHPHPWYMRQAYHCILSFPKEWHLRIEQVVKEFWWKAASPGRIFHSENLMWHSTASVARHSERWSIVCGEIPTSEPLRTVLSRVQENPDVTHTSQVPLPMGDLEPHI